MKLITGAISASILALLGAAPALAEESRDFDLDGFTGIDTSAGVHLEATVGGGQSIRVETKKGDFTDFKIKVKNGVLYVSRKSNGFMKRGRRARYNVYVTAPDLSSLDSSSGSHASITGIDNDFTADASSGAHATLTGSGNDCTFDVSSGGHINAKELQCVDVSADASSGGHVKVYASQSINADASSGGHVSVYGSPNERSTDKSSGGAVSFKDE